MDRYEYKIREEEIQKLIDKRQLDDAIAIADTVDWRKETSVKMLFKISGLYAACKRCQESKEILLMALNRYPENRRIVFALCELSLKLNEIVQAQEYYRDFSRIAPTDPDRYILKYKIFQTLDVGLEERAELLEQFKQEDYRPKWGYELAELYHEMGMGSKCVDECEELIVTFGEGKYVIKAMQLKAQHESLTESEQARYEDYIAEQDREIMEISEEEDVLPLLPVIQIIFESVYLPANSISLMTGILCSKTFFIIGAVSGMPGLLIISSAFRISSSV